MSELNYFEQIVRSFIKQGALIDNSICLPDKTNNEQIGMLICGMANTAFCDEIPYFYAFWGISKEDKSVNGTTLCPPDKYELAQHLSTGTAFEIRSLEYNGKNVVLLEVRAAQNKTVQYDGIEYVIKDNALVRLSEVLPSISEKLSNKMSTNNKKYEFQIALRNISSVEIEKYLDCKKLFYMLQLALPNSTLGIMSVLSDLGFITEEHTGKYNITNLGALLLAKRLSIFDSVKFKAVRVLIYSGNDFTKPAHEQIGGKGYVVGFEGLIDYIEKHLPQVEYIDGSIRKKKPIFSILVIRELVANAMIHQDLTENGGPIISIFEDHITISNPGKPSIDQRRFIDSPPYSRNEALAVAMHKVGICEERGSGYDKVISFIEEENLPAPEINISDKSTSVILKSSKSFTDLRKDELIQICYAHACLNVVQGKTTNNTSLRSRLNLSDQDRYKVSRIFENAIAAGLIKKKEGTGAKNREYLPWWT